MKLYNTLTKSKEEFVPLTEGKVRMYVCGPTVYNLIHIGNARPMIVFDTARRYMEYKGYEVNFVSNFTDVDDKIIAKAIEEGVDSEVISTRYIKECKKDMEAMNVRPATTHPLATQEIDGMIDMIQTLVDKGYAYNADGTVYFRTRKFQEYGKLSHKNLDDLRSGGRSPARDGGRFQGRSAGFCALEAKRSESRPGSRHGATGVRAGISNVPLCPKSISAMKSISMREGRILYFPTMKMRLRRVSAATARYLPDTGCIMRF